MPKTTLSTFFESEYRSRRLRGKSDNTVRLYRLSIRSFAKTLGHDPTLEDLTDDNVSRHMQRVIDNGRAKATANKDRSQILAIWRYAAQKNKINRWPDVLEEIEPVRVPKAWTREDLEQLFAEAYRQPGYFGSVPRSLWWQAILMICLDTAERIGAVSQLRWEWIEHGWVTFPAEVRKGKRRDKRFRLSAASANLLLAVQKVTTDRERVFPWPYCQLYLWKLYGNLLRDAGLPHGRKDKFHRLRKTTASVSHAKGLDATDILDHASRKTTLRYLDPSFSREDQASDAVSEWMGE